MRWYSKTGKQKNLYPYWELNVSPSPQPVSLLIYFLSWLVWSTIIECEKYRYAITDKIMVLYITYLQQCSKRLNNNFWYCKHQFPLALFRHQYSKTSRLPCTLPYFTGICLSHWNFLMPELLFWVITQWVVVIPYRHFGRTPWRSLYPWRWE
jgi:hypothetical protein